MHDSTEEKARAIPPLIAALQDEQAAVRYAAIDALGNLKATEAIPGLTRCLAEDHDEGARVRAVRSLRQIGGAATLSPLERALHDPQPAIRRAASVALGKLGLEQALPLLLTALASEPDERVQRSIILTLGEMGNPHAIPALKQLQHQHDTSSPNALQQDLAYALKRLR